MDEKDNARPPGFKAAKSWDEVPSVVDARPAEMTGVAYGYAGAIAGNEVVVACEGGGIGMVKITFNDRDEAWKAYCEGLRVEIKVVKNPWRDMREQTEVV